MLKKIVAIRNVGRFRNSASGGNTQFGRITLINGANGYGKSTICAILRSLRTGKPEYILGRATLGAAHHPEVQLLTEHGPLHFDGTTWSGACPHLAIFDGVFVAETVYVGDVVDVEQRRGLYRVIVGEQGRAFADEESALATQSRAQTSAISAAERALRTHVPTGMTLDTFIGLPALDDVDAQIEMQEDKLRLVSQAATIKERALLKGLAITSLPENLSAIFATTIENIAEDAEQTVATHIAAHQMGEKGTSWLQEGLEYAQTPDCPFCGQSLEGLPLVGAYRAVFGDRYRELLRDVNSAREQINFSFNETSIANLNVIAEQYRNSVAFWSNCGITGFPEFPLELGAIFERVQSALTAMLDRKASAPLEPLELDAASVTAIDDLVHAQEKVRSFNSAVALANEAIKAKKTEVGDGNTTPVKEEITRLKAAKVRHTRAVASLCDERAAAADEKRRIDEKKVEVRELLSLYLGEVLEPYQNRINEILDDFNAGFTIGNTEHSFPAGVASSSYEIIINKKAVNLGGASTPEDVPSFRNTLSAGDRSALALAFFIAHVERDANLSQSIIVFDDPFSSQDSFRRLQTVHEILNMGNRCAQVIVLSHDSSFLRQIWDKVAASDRACVGIVDHGELGSKILEFDIEKACRGRTRTDIDDLVAFYRTRVGQPVDIVRKMRTVLEAHLSITYLSCFQEAQWLGDMIKEIREAGPSHPAYPLYEDLDLINETAPYHHGEDLLNVRADSLDFTELNGLVKKTLRIVNALQA